MLMADEQSEMILSVEGLKKYYPIPSAFPLGILPGFKRFLCAVDGVSFEIRKGETLGLVGESGSGKSTIASMILGLTEPTAGTVRFRGRSVASTRAAREQRKQVGAVFQNPYASLDPRMRVGRIVAEPITAHKVLARGEVNARVTELLKLVGLNESDTTKYPHQFSGGQRQRVALARALALNPSLLVADEPVSALDVSIQAQIINLMMDLRERFALSMLFIAHDLSVVYHVSDRVAVVYMGRIMELAPSDALFRTPRHPYTRALLSAIPDVDGRSVVNTASLIKGEIAIAVKPFECCRFQDRCPEAQAVCRESDPAAVEVSEGHTVACHLVSSVVRAGVTEQTRLLDAGSGGYERR